MPDRLISPSVEGVLETSLYVDNLETSLQFYRRIFGFEPLYCEPGRMASLSVSGIQVLLLFLKEASTEPIEISGSGTIPPHDGKGELHLAFGIASRDFETWRIWLRDHGISIEGEMRWERGGQSLYFRDPDRHLLELVTPGVWQIR
jgi:catechol 2,3-dioxygenase-like lactoylglutathione lyase family enzyme